MFLLGVFSTHLPQVFKKSVKVMSQVLGADAVKKSLPVGVASLESKDIKTEFSSHAFLRANKEDTLRFPQNSTVKSLVVKLGDQVKKGQLLATLSSEAQSLKSELDNIESQTREIDFRVTMALAKKEYLSKNEVSQKKLERRAFLIRKRLGELDSSAVLRSPISGIVSELSAHEGDYIDNPQNYVLKIADTKSQSIDLYVPQNIMTHLSRNKEVFLSKSGEEAKGFVRAFAPVVDVKTGSVYAEIVVPKSPSSWLPGMYVETKIPLQEEKGALTAPTRSIVYDEGKAYVFVVKSKEASSEIRAPAAEGESLNYVKKTPVTVGISENGMTSIQGDVEEFDQIVSEGISGLVDGSFVEITSF